MRTTKMATEKTKISRVKWDISYTTHIHLWNEKIDTLSTDAITLYNDISNFLNNFIPRPFSNHFHSSTHFQVDMCF